MPSARGSSRPDASGAGATGHDVRHGSCLIRRTRAVLAAATAVALALAPLGAGRALAAAVAEDDAYSHLEDQPLTVLAAEGLLANDDAGGGPALCVLAVMTPGLESQLSVEEDGSFTFTMPDDAFGVTSFVYALGEVDGADCAVPALGANGEVVITTTAVNDPPEIALVGDCLNGVAVAEDSGAYGPENCIEVDTLGANEDELQELDPWVVSTANPALFSEQPALSNALTAKLTFTPAANAHGSTTVSIRARDDGGTANGGVNTSDAIQVTIEITSVNDAPTAVADSFFALVDRTLNVGPPGVLINDGDIDSGSISAVKVSNPSHGVVTLAADGSFSYTPDTGYEGPDAFSYRVTDGSLSSPTRVVSLTVSTVPPINTPTPFPSVAPSVAPTQEATPGEPSASAEAPPSLAPGETPGPTAEPPPSPSLAPGVTPGPEPSPSEGGGVSLPVLLLLVLFALLLAFGAAVYVPKWLAQQRGDPPDTA